MQKYKLLELARILRKKSTIAENILWRAIKNRKFMDLKFRRQYWINNYIVDFICMEYNLIIELDGNFHAGQDQKVSDALRTDVLIALNFKVIRFWNWEILNDLPKVLQDIAKNIGIEC